MYIFVHTKRNTDMSTTTWMLDTAHSEVQFKARHLMITTVTGQFTEFDAQVSTEGTDFTRASVRFTAKVGSLTTGNEQRDAHLKSDDFFNSEKYPELVFAGTNMKHEGGEKYTLEGDLTIRDVTRKVHMDVEFGGIVQDPWGNTKAGFTLSGKINRKEFGLQWSAVTEAGHLVVSDDIRIQAEVQFAKSN